MTKLLERDDPPHHIIIETSGLALPQPLVRAFTWPEIRARVTVDGVITVVDSAALAEGRFASDEAAVQAQREADPELDHESPLEELFEDQLACADMILLNKADLLAAEQLDRIERDLTGEVRPGVRFLRARDGKVDLAVLLGLGAGAETDLEVRKSHHEMLGEADHDHDDFTSFVVALPPIASQAELIDRLSRAILKQDILRVKGFAAIEGKAMRLVVQAAGPRIDSYFDRPWGAEEVRAGALVVIGESGLDAALVQEALTAALVT